MREVAVAWRTVEMADEQRHHTRIDRVTSRRQSSAKPFPGVSASEAVDKASTKMITCFECREPGHLARNCPLHTLISKTSSSARGRAGTRGSWVVHDAWTTAAAGAAAAITAAGAAQQRQPQHWQQQQQQQQQRFSAHQPGSTHFSVAGKGHGGASSTAFHESHVGGRAGFSGDTEPAGAGRATEVLPPHPIPSSANAPASVNAPAADGPGESGPYVPAFRGVLLGSVSGFSVEGVAVDEGENGVKPACRGLGQLLWRRLMWLLYSTRGLVSRPCLLRLRTSCKRHFLMCVLWGAWRTRRSSSGGWPCARGPGENVPGADCSAHQLAFGHHGAVFLCSHARQRRRCHFRKPNF